MTYYCITTSINNRNGLMTFDYTDLYIGEHRPSSSYVDKPYGVTEYKDWYTSREIADTYPDIAERYNFE